MSIPPSFSTALLTGGASARMGTDKALLTLPGDDGFLWERQWRILAGLEPGEMLFSGAPRLAPPDGCRVILDKKPGAGPLAGVSACLDEMSTELLLVLAVDLPQMNEDFLRRLLRKCRAGCGAVPQGAEFFEPLAAVYPKELAPLARQHLQQGRYAMQDFVCAAVHQNAVERVPINCEDEPLFRNLNSPSDLLVQARRVTPREELGR